MSAAPADARHRPRLIRPHRRHRRRPDGQRHRPCLRARRAIDVRADRHQRRGARSAVATRSTRNLARQVARGRITRGRKGRGAGAHRDRRSIIALFGDCDMVIEAATENEDDQARDLQAADAASEARRADRHQHLVDLDHPARRRDRPARQVHRHAFHEPGAGDEPGRADPRHRHRRGDLCADPRAGA